MSYSDPNSTVRRESFHATAGGAATTEYNKFRTFQKMKLKKVHAIVLVAGTNAGHGFGVYSGTTSIGAISLGTSAAGVAAASAVLDAEVAAYGQVSVKSLVDATGTAQIIYEYDVLPDAVQT